MSEIEKSDEPVGIRQTFIAVSILGIIGTIVALWLKGTVAARSVAIGAALAVANLWLLAQMVRGFLARKGTSAPWSIVAVLKFVLLFGAMYLLVRTRIVEILPCVFGFGALPIGIVLAEVLGVRGNSGQG
jgi:hypothetical protein